MARESPGTERTVLMEPAPAPAPRGAVPRLKRVLIGLGVGLGVLAAAYAAGRLQASSRIDAAEAQASAKAIEWSSEHTTVLRLEARRRLHLALTALDAKNFGIAQEHLTAALKQLGATHPESESELGKLQKQIASYQLKASENVGADRDQIAGWIRRFDDAVPPAKAP